MPLSCFSLQCSLTLALSVVNLERDVPCGADKPSLVCLAETWSGLCVASQDAKDAVRVTPTSSRLWFCTSSEVRKRAMTTTAVTGTEAVLVGCLRWLARSFSVLAAAVMSPPLSATLRQRGGAVRRTCTDWLNELDMFLFHWPGRIPSAIRFHASEMVHAVLDVRNAIGDGEWHPLTSAEALHMPARLVQRLAPTVSSAPKPIAPEMSHTHLAVLSFQALAWRVLHFHHGTAGSSVTEDHRLTVEALVRWADDVIVSVCSVESGQRAAATHDGSQACVMCADPLLTAASNTLAACLNSASLESSRKDEVQRPVFSAALVTALQAIDATPPHNCPPRCAAHRALHSHLLSKACVTDLVAGSVCGISSPHLDTASAPPTANDSGLDSDDALVRLLCSVRCAGGVPDSPGDHSEWTEEQLTAAHAVAAFLSTLPNADEVATGAIISEDGRTAPQWSC